MDNLFGTGRVLPGTGFLLAASPVAVPPPLLAAAIAWNEHTHAFRAAVGGSGQAAAPLAVAAWHGNTLRTGRPMPAPVPDPGRANVDRLRALSARRDSGTCALGDRPARRRPRGRQRQLRWR